MKEVTGKRGFIGAIVLIVLALAALKFFFHFNIVDFLKSPDVVSFFSYIKKFFHIIWFKYIGGVFWYIWNDIVIDVIWKTLGEGYALLKAYVNSN
jgi:hypothetical protein